MLGVSRTTGVGAALRSTGHDGPMPIARSTITGVATGAVVLAAAAGFGIGLPKLIDDPGATITAEDLPTLPDRLDDRFVALGALTAADAGAESPEDGALVENLANAAAQGDTDAAGTLTDLYGPATVRAYVDVQVMADLERTVAPAQMSVTVVPGDTGLVIPSGPFTVDQSGSHYELREINGHRCAVAWQDPVDPTTGQPTGGEVPASNYQAECRASRDGLSYDVYATGLDPEELAGYLDLVLEVTA